MAGDNASAVKTGQIERVLDTIVQKQLRLETSGASYTSIMSRFASELDTLFGQPGGSGALDTSLNDFTNALQGLAADPASASVRGTALNAGSILADRIGSIAESVQTLRSEAEGRIATAVGKANDLLKGIGQLDSKIISSPSSAAAPGLLDERDRLITDLSQLMDIHVIQAPSGSVTVSTTGGLTLFTGGAPVQLSFDARGKLGPEAVYSRTASQRGVGTITATTLGGISTDVVANNLIRSGEIAGALELRDTTLPEVQRQLDELAAGLARALSDRQVSGTPATSGAQAGLQLDFSGWQPGNAITLDYRNTPAGGALKRILLVPTNGSAPATIPAGDLSDPGATVIRVDMSGGFAAAASAIQAELTSRGINLTVTSPAANKFQVLDDGLAGTTDVAALSAGITVTTLNSGSPQLPFFVDTGYGNTAYTGSFEGGSHLRGLAQRLAVNPSVKASRGQALVVYDAALATPQGDGTRPQFLADALSTSTRAFSSAAVVGGQRSSYVSTVTDFAQRLVEGQGANAEAAKRLDEGQSVALSSVESRFAETSAVNVDQEMSQLVQLQTAYGANARVLTAIRDMMDILMRM
jgi:flagellar hook-associated protein 1 FlgK